MALEKTTKKVTCPFLCSLIFLLKIICVYLLRKKLTVGEGEEVGGGVRGVEFWNVLIISGYSHDRVMTFILGRVHSILYIFFCICLHKWRHFVPVQVIPELVHSGFYSEWNSRSGTKFHPGIIANRVVWSERACVSGLAQKRRERERLRLGRSILSRECSTNFTLERNSLRNEIHSGII